MYSAVVVFDRNPDGTVREMARTPVQMPEWAEDSGVLYLRVTGIAAWKAKDISFSIARGIPFEGEDQSVITEGNNPEQTVEEKLAEDNDPGDTTG